MGFLHDSEFWVAVSFFIFIGVVIYYKVPVKLTKLLDNRARLITAELDEARKLKEEAAKVLEDYRRRQGDAVKEAESIISIAAREAQSLAEDTRRTLAEQFDRRIRLAEEKIARAETQAIADVRAAAADAAVKAAETLITARLTPEKADQLLKDSIEALSSKLN